MNSKKNNLIITKIFLICCLSVSLLGCGSAKYFIDFYGKEAKTYYFQTEDNWRLAMNHYPAKKKSFLTKPRAPILLCHGLGYNSLFWVLDDKINLAKYLSDRGFDVWLLSLRGSGLSTKPGISVIKNITETRPGELNNISFKPSFLNWSIDDYINYDIPAALKFICEKTGKKQITWVGHSLGGMIMYAYLGKNKPDRIRSVVTIGSPIIIPQPPNQILQAFAEIKNFFKACLIINIRSGATAIAPFHEFINTPDKVLFYNSDNINDETVTKVLTYVVEDLPLAVVDQMIKMIQTGIFTSKDGSINYTEQIKNIDVPILLICGKADNLAPPESVRYVYHQIKSERKKFIMFGIANGYKKDYGHNDLILGKNADTEVYPKIFKWLKLNTKLNK